MAQGKPKAETLLPLAGELREFEAAQAALHEPGKELEWANGLYTTPHIQFELQTNLTR